jgi:hypothetical protein
MIQINLQNFLTVSLVAFVGVFLINRALGAAGLDAWKA